MGTKVSFFDHISETLQLASDSSPPWRF